jgi:hypothetical protein
MLLLGTGVDGLGISVMASKIVDPNLYHNLGR